MLSSIHASSEPAISRPLRASDVEEPEERHEPLLLEHPYHPRQGRHTRNESENVCDNPDHAGMWMQIPTTLLCPGGSSTNKLPCNRIQGAKEYTLVRKSPTDISEQVHSLSPHLDKLTDFFS
jgi:hypothetical protein